MKLYILYHEFETDSPYYDDECVKILGIFTSVQKAYQAIERYKNLPGFKDYHESSFKVYPDNPDYLNKVSWKEGFVRL